MNRFGYSLLLLCLTMMYSCEVEEGMEDNGGKNYSSIGSSPGNLNIALGGETYNEVGENPFIQVSEEAVSTFSIDADGASYANVRRFLQQDNRLPPNGAVRTEELINYFNLDYAYSDPTHPIEPNGEVSFCPWDSSHKLIRIGIKGRPIAPAELPASNFVFLIDVSGSMSGADRLDLLKQGFKEFVDQMSARDKIAIVTYASTAKVELASTSGDRKADIKAAIDRLVAGGSTAGGEGIDTAYAIAEEAFIQDGNNRVIIGTDGDFNVGPSSQEELISLIELKRDNGIFLSILGVGRGNLNDAALEQIADNGNGTYDYLDKMEELKRVFIDEKSRFYTVAKDVKVQVEFNPANVRAYRLIGYENRLVNQQDFEDDEEDAGEIGANQSVTAIYEIVPNDNSQFESVPTFTIDIRYKEPDANVSIPLQLDIYDQGAAFSQSSDFMKFTSSVAAFAMLITDSQYKGSCTYDEVLNWLNSQNLNDPHALHSEFYVLVNQAKGL